ncbi:MAG: response regulator transcription factor [Phycisphaerae bacterium]|nr:response regulator transcription factor [Phycisphaerae bacterium]
MGAIAARLEYEHHCTVVGVVRDPAKAAGMLAHRRADIALVDMDEAGADRLGTIEVLRTTRPDIRIILISATIDDDRIDRALRAGVNGFLAKDELPATIASAIREVLAGGAYFPEAVRSRIVVDADGTRLERLTPRDGPAP